jgi:hypothetical protein
MALTATNGRIMGPFASGLPLALAGSRARVAAASVVAIAVARPPSGINRGPHPRASLTPHGSVRRREPQDSRRRRP